MALAVSLGMALMSQY